MILISRRSFFLLLASAGALRTLGRSRTTAGPTLRIILLDDGSALAADVRRGAEMAIDEARRSAAMFGGTISVGQTIEPSKTAIVVVVDGRADPAQRSHAINATLDADALYMNVVDHSEEMQGVCRRHVFHVTTEDEPYVWHESLTRFGAEQLNNRYRERFGRGMTSESWTGWFAVKSAWEGTLRSKAASARELLEYLERPTTRFDGHKGVPLYFDGAHNLVQPAYLSPSLGAPPTEVFADLRPWREPRPQCQWR